MQTHTCVCGTTSHTAKWRFSILTHTRRACKHTNEALSATSTVAPLQVKQHDGDDSLRVNLLKISLCNVAANTVQEQGKADG